MKYDGSEKGGDAVLDSIGTERLVVQSVTRKWQDSAERIGQGLGEEQIEEVHCGPSEVIKCSYGVSLRVSPRSRNGIGACVRACVEDEGWMVGCAKR